MKTKLSDRHWILFILFLLIIEVGWLLIDLQWIQVPIFMKKSSVVGLKEAGYVIKASEDLKRRGANSLIWDGAREKDILYYKDSILTLSQSTAKLYLKDQTELQLSENTLVTIEEPDDKTKSEIRLRFSKGDLKARNPTNKTSIQGEDWVVNLEKGSEIALRKDRDSYEFEVISGQARLQTASGGSESLNDSKIFKLGEDKEIKTLTKNRNIQWKDKKPLRLYTNADESKVKLDWTGQASDVSIQKSGEAEIKQAVPLNKTAAVIPLKLGNYKVRLSGEDGYSEAREVEIWKAPRIYLKKPLPRDRIPAGQAVEFVWTSEAGVKNYQLKFSSVKKSETPPSMSSVSENFQSVKFDDEFDLTWKVEGYDQDGFLVPAFYENPIYIREQPLQAPQLKAPQIHEPAPDEKIKDGASSNIWLNKLKFLVYFFQTKANAAEHYEITFQWEPVAGANKYVLEVSQTPDFRDPVLIENVKSTEYVWKKVKYKKYYWRVAAASSKGRMGFFSEPLELKLEDIKKVETPIASQASLIVTAKPIIVVEKPVVKEEVVITKSHATWGLAWMPSYKLVDATGAENTKLHLAGGILQGVQLQYQTPQWGRHVYNLTLRRSQQTWKPEPEAEYPFQKSLFLSESWIQLERSTVNESQRLGLVLHESFYPVRSSNETISLISVFSLGPRISWSNVAAFENPKTIGLSFLYGKDLMEFNLDYEYKYYFSEPEKTLRFYIGSSGNALYQMQKTNSGIHGNLNLLFGFDQF